MSEKVTPTTSGLNYCFFSTFCSLAPLLFGTSVIWHLCYLAPLLFGGGDDEPVSIPAH